MVLVQELSSAHCNMEQPDQDPPHKDWTGPEILNALQSGNKDMICKILSLFPISMTRLYGVTGYLGFQKIPSQLPPPSTDLGNFLLSEDDGKVRITYIETADRPDIGKPNHHSQPAFHAGFFARNLLPCPDKIDKSAMVDVGPMLDHFPPGGTVPFLVLTKPLDISTLCFVVHVTGDLHIASFVPMGAKSGVKEIQKADLLGEYISACFKAPAYAGKLCARDFRRSKKKAEDKGFGGFRENDKCVIIVLWVPNQGWHIHAQVLRPRKKGKPRDLVPALVVCLYSSGSGAEVKELWKKPKEPKEK